MGADSEQLNKEAQHQSLVLCQPSSSSTTIINHEFNIRQHQIPIFRKNQLQQWYQIDNITNFYIPLIKIYSKRSTLIINSSLGTSPRLSPSTINSTKYVFIRKFPSLWSFSALFCVFLALVFASMVSARNARYLMFRSGQSKDAQKGISQLFLPHKPRMRRSKSTCTIDDYSKTGVQEALFRIIMGAKTELTPLVRQITKNNGDTNSSTDSSNEANCNGENNVAYISKQSDAIGLDVEISPDMPLEMRAVCGFNYEENINERRIPRSIRQVKCLCKIPQQSEGIRCEAVYYNVSVLIFDETCTTFHEKVEQIAFACVPVLTSQTQSGFTMNIGIGREVDTII